MEVVATQYRERYLDIHIDIKKEDCYARWKSIHNC